MRTFILNTNIISGVRYSKDNSDYYYESTNYDPQLELLGHNNLKNWVYVQFNAKSEENRAFKLYYDRGNGFNEEDSIVISHINSKELKTYSKILNIGCSIKAIRLDVGDFPGKFSIIDIEVKQLSKINVLALASRNYVTHFNNGGYLNLLIKAIKYGRKSGIKSLWNKSKLFLNLNENHNNSEYSFYEHRSIDWEYKEMKHQVYLSIIIDKCEDTILLSKSIESLECKNYPKMQILCIGSLECDVDNITLYATREHAYKNVASDYIININCGDVLENTTMSIVNQIIQEYYPNIIYADEDRVNANDEHYAPFHKLKHKNCINHKIIGDFYVIKRQILKENGYNDIKAIYKALEDIECVFHIDKILYSKRLIRDRICLSNIKAIAFYLPQFHPIPENDEWWGEGFTEWVNTKRAVPMFQEHYQPHIPERLGYYDLMQDDDIQKMQIELAKEHGIYGFCYYYYWFEGKKLLEKPLEKLLRNKNLDFPFCICWANETWSRRWDGQDKEILIKQVHNKKTDEEFIYDVIPIMKDQRYIRINNKPMLLVYRAELFPNLKETIKIWNDICVEEGLGNIEVMIVQSFGITDPRPYGANYAVEFPPHGILASMINDKIKTLRSDFKGNIYDYREVVDRCLAKEKQEYGLFRSCMLSWDNTARRMTSSNIFAYSSPNEYSKWLNGICDYTERFNNQEEQFVFINAWNEWAEGTHLEPDIENGTKYLQATKDVISNYEKKDYNYDELVSVIIPSYNYEKYIVDAINSVFSQSYKNIELIILDDCSKDNSVKLVSEYISKDIIKNRFANLIFKKGDTNKGAHYTINEGIKLARGKWITILNADDLFEYNRISNMIMELEIRGKSIGFSKVKTINTDGEKCTSDESIKFESMQKNLFMCQYVHISLLKENVAISTGNMIFTKELYEKVGGFKDYKYCHDWDFILRASFITEPIYVDSTNYFYRLHDNNSFRNLQNIADDETKKIFSDLRYKIEQKDYKNKNINESDVLRLLTF